MSINKKEFNLEQVVKLCVVVNISLFLFVAFMLTLFVYFNITPMIYYSVIALIGYVFYFMLLKRQKVCAYMWCVYATIIICITKISTFLILCDLAVCLATLYVSFSLVFALMRYLQGKVFLIRFYSPTTLSSSRAEFRLPSRLACA